MRTANRFFFENYASTIGAHQRARAIAKPIVNAVKESQREARLAGRRPTIACLGDKQYEILERYVEAIEEIGVPGTVCGLRIIWTNDADLVAVYEERDGGWV